MKNFLPLLSLLILFVGCEKDITQISPVDNTADSIQASTFLVSANRNVTQPPVLTGTVYDLLGYGYDVTGQFADISAAREQVVDIQRLRALSPSRVSVLRSAQSGSPMLVTGENAEQFSDQLSNQLNATKGLRVFKSSVTAAFPDSNSLSGKFIYGSSTSIIAYKIVKFNYTAGYEPAEPFLNPAFSADIQNISPADLVKKYGTHILSNIRLGAKLEVTYQAETAREDKPEAALVGLTFGLQKIFGLSTGYFFGGLSYASRNANQKLFYKTVGGDPAKLPTLTADNTKNPTIDIREWITSCTAETATMIEIDTNGLMPIFDMIQDSAKKAAVKAYIDQYLLAGRVQLKK